MTWSEGQPYFPDFCRRVLYRDVSIPLTFIAFDVLQIAGEDMMSAPYSERREALDRLDLNGPSWTTSETFEDGEALFRAVCKHGLEGVVAKRVSSR